eukprot:m.57233 g.57233  ORF g.57233 m.57233 type:complete len:254 (+) comp49016_c0_seq2:1015-1776(+)
MCPPFCSVRAHSFSWSACTVMHPATSTLGLFSGCFWRRSRHLIVVTLCPHLPSCGPFLGSAATRSSPHTSRQAEQRPAVVFRMGSFFSGLFAGLWGEKERRILILGLDGAGKTTILYRLQVGEVVTTIPTIGFNVEAVTFENIKFQVWDLGGQTSIRPYWRCYYANTDAIIFVVDSADKERMGIAKSELVSMLEEEELKNAVLLVFANKQDQAGAMTPSEVSAGLFPSASASLSSFVCEFVSLDGVQRWVCPR